MTANPEKFPSITVEDQWNKGNVQKLWDEFCKQDNSIYKIGIKNIG